MIANVGHIWEAASTVDDRPMLRGVMFDAERGTLTASDSYIAARVPCEVQEGDESGCIPAEALKEANGRSLLIAGGTATLTYPDGGTRTWKMIEPADPQKYAALFAAAPFATVPVGLNVALLARLAKALRNGGPPQIAIHPSAPRRAVRVSLGPNGSGEGLIMPVVITGESNADAPTAAPDLSNDDAVIAAARAALRKLDRRQGKAKAAQAFRDALAGWKA